jgi:hypothetical protein
VAEHRVRSRRQYGRHRPGGRLDPSITDRIDAAVDGHEVPSSNPGADRPRGDAERQQLSPGDVPILIDGNAGDCIAEFGENAHT